MMDIKKLKIDPRFTWRGAVGEIKVSSLPVPEYEVKSPKIPFWIKLLSSEILWSALAALFGFVTKQYELAIGSLTVAGGSMLYKQQPVYNGKAGALFRAVDSFCTWWLGNNRKIFNSLHKIEK